MVTVSGNIVDIRDRKIAYGEVDIQEGRIAQVKLLGEERAGAPYLLPGFTDAHVHIESSMLVPAEFARLAVVHGTVATVSDPHEIANVCGMAGVTYMIENGRTVPFHFFFGAPSCVPATPFETAGARLDAADVTRLLQMEEVKYLSEMMNFPGVLNGDADVMEKISAARKLGKPVDGHAPGLKGAEARKYIEAGISTDHECFTEEEALEKLQYGMKILIREGSAARNFDALVPLLHEHADRMMFCSDDKHPDSLAEGHINLLCARAVAAGINVFSVLQAACINPVEHYRLEVGLLRAGDAADFIAVKDLRSFEVLQTYIGGTLVAEEGRSLIGRGEAALPVNQFLRTDIAPESLQVAFAGEKEVAVIEALDGQLITNKVMMAPKTENGLMVPDTDRDLLKLVVVNRYKQAPPAVAWITNFGLKEGAIASSVAHDSHNLIAVGTDDASLLAVLNDLQETGGGIAAKTTGGTAKKLLPLPVAGLMSTDDGYAVAAAYTEIDRFVKERLGATLKAPFMTLSFMALLVIPHLKLSDMGLFDGDAFEFV